MKLDIAMRLDPQTIERILNAVLDRIQLPPGIPPLYRSGVRYRRADPGEHWQHPEETWRLGGGDCEDLALWRAAELRSIGFPARVRVYRTGPHTLHVVVDRGDGIIEDPSRVLGMGSEVSGDDPATAAATTAATLAATAALGPAGGIAVQMAASPEGRKLLKRLMGRK